MAPVDQESFHDTVQDNGSNIQENVGLAPVDVRIFFSNGIYKVGSGEEHTSTLALARQMKKPSEKQMKVMAAMATRVRVHLR
jgi:hypothetical protein